MYHQVSFHFSQRLPFGLQPTLFIYLQTHTRLSFIPIAQNAYISALLGNQELRVEWIVIIIAHRDGTSSAEEQSGSFASLEIGETAQSVEQFGVKLPSTSNSAEQQEVRASSSSRNKSWLAIVEFDIHLVVAIKSRVTNAVVHQLQADWTSPLPTFFPCCMAAGCSPVKDNGNVRL